MTESDIIRNESQQEKKKRDKNERPASDAPILAFLLDDVKKASGFGHTKIYEEIAAGRLIARKAGRRTFFLPEDVEAWLRAMPVVEPRMRCSV